MVNREADPIRVLVACSGVGHVMRGFETFALECHRALREDPRLSVVLARASGPPSEGERRARTIGRESRPARALGAAARRDGYFAEQMVYAASLIPVIASERPAVVYLSDWALAGALGRLRALGRARFRLLLSNGAAGPPPYDRTIDHVQQLTPYLHDLAVAAGEPATKHTLLPLGVEVEERLELLSAGDRASLRERLGLPREGELVLSVAALNNWSKRCDYVVNEVAAVEPRPHLVLLGQQEGETPAVLAHATRLLGPDGFTARTVPPEEVADYYRAADVFVLGSLHEAMARVLVEALGHGLPTLSHDGEVMRFVTGDQGRRADLSRQGALTRMLTAAHAAPGSAAERRERHGFARETFGWEALRPRYVDMIERVAR
jgi:1,2-diacylglycerol 3-alpha-glucosyltransferase